MAMENLPELVRDWKLECDCSDIHNSTLQIRYVTNAAEGLWRQRVEERWQRKHELGRGSCGVVWLEECVSGVSEGQLRAVKELHKAPLSTTSKYYAKELEAIVKFSHERVGSSMTSFRIKLLIKKSKSIAIVSSGPSGGLKI